MKGHRKSVATESGGDEGTRLLGHRTDGSGRRSAVNPMMPAHRYSIVGANPRGPVSYVEAPGDVVKRPNQRVHSSRAPVSDLYTSCGQRRLDDPLDRRCKVVAREPFELDSQTGELEG